MGRIMAKDTTPYKRTKAEQEAWDQYEARLNSKPQIITMANAGDEENPNALKIDHADPATAVRMWALALGTTDYRTADALVNQLANLSVRDGVVNVQLLNQHLGFVQSMQPRDPMEAALLGQMSAVQGSMMEMTRRLGVAETLDRIEIYERAVNKLARTFTAQMETLKRYRTGGVQKVVVQHVQVNEGGQAVVAGEFNGSMPTGGGSNENGSQPHEREQMRLSECPSVPCDLETIAVPLQSARR